MRRFKYYKQTCRMDLREVRFQLACSSDIKAIVEAYQPPLPQFVRSANSIYMYALLSKGKHYNVIMTGTHRTTSGDLAR